MTMHKLFLAATVLLVTLTLTLHSRTANANELTGLNSLDPSWGPLLDSDDDPYAYSMTYVYQSYTSADVTVLVDLREPGAIDSACPGSTVANLGIPAIGAYAATNWSIPSLTGFSGSGSVTASGFVFISAGSDIVADQVFSQLIQ